MKAMTLSPLRVALAATLMVAILILGGCSSSAGTDPKVVEGSWVLESFGGATELEPADATVTTELTLSDGEAAGNGGVNSFSGTYRVGSDNELTFGTLASTLMAGPQPAMEQESRFLKGLDDTEHFEVVDGKLVLSDAGNNTIAVMVPK